MSDQEEEVYDAIIYYPAGATSRVTEQEIREQRGLMDPRIKIVIQHIMLPIEPIAQNDTQSKTNNKKQ